MKKLFITFVVLLIAGTFATTNLNAQTSVYTWEDYGLQFSIPDTHELKKNTADEFESGDESTWLELFPYKDSKETAQGMIEKVAANGGFTIQEKGKYTSGGYQGYWVKSESAEYPEWQYWLIGFIDPTSPTNFYAIIWWKKGDQDAYKIAWDMSYSFKKKK
jgi:hypothetical protein